MILALISDIDEANGILTTTFLLAEKLKKEAAVLCYVNSVNEIESKRNRIESELEALKFNEVRLFVHAGSERRLSDDCEKLEAAFLLIQTVEWKKKVLKRYLSYCRELRIPYLFYRKEFGRLKFNKVLVPVRFLEEDYEKAQFAAAFGRFFNSEIRLLQAKDYGSKAGITTGKIATMLDKFSLNYKVVLAEKDSYKLYKESLKVADKDRFDLVVLSASRTYGPDDLLFGPRELHLLKRASHPLLIINPRGDLYTLCD